MVELKNVSVTYNNYLGADVEALKRVNLTVKNGEFVFIVGTSGAGKSTLIKLMLKEIEPTVGSVLVNDFNLKKLPFRKVHKLRRTIGIVFQDFRLIPGLNVYDNIAFVLRAVGKNKKYIQQRVPFCLDLVALSDKSYSMPYELSGGEQQRVALARALANNPPLIIADEPTGNIDPELSYEIIELLKAINNKGVTIIMVTHEHDLVQYFGGRTISISNGQVVSDIVMRGKS